MLSDIVLNDVVLRLIDDWFPGTEIAWYGYGEEPSDEHFHAVPYRGDLEEGRSIGGILVPNEGPLATGRARGFIENLPALIISAFKWRHPVERYGTISRLGGTDAHLEFDERLIGATIRLETRREGVEIDQSIQRYLPLLRSASGRRYEGTPPEISLLLEDLPMQQERWLGRLSLDLLNEDKSILLICAGGGAALEVDSEGRIRGLAPLPQQRANREESKDLFSPIALKSLARASQETGSVAVHLDAAPSISVFVDGFCRFRFKDGRYTWVEPDVAAESLGGSPLAVQFVELGASLAARGKGAIIVPVDRNQNLLETLEPLVDQECLPVLFDKWDNTLWHHLLSPKGKFRSWLLMPGANIRTSPHSLLETALGSDGASFFDRVTGDLLGYGAIVSTQDSTPGEGARTTAAKFLSQKFGSAIKVSEDHHAVLYREGEVQCQIW